MVWGCKGLVSSDICHSGPEPSVPAGVRKMRFAAIGFPSPPIRVAESIQVDLLPAWEGQGVFLYSVIQKIGHV